MANQHYDEYEICYYEGRYSCQDCNYCPYRYECSGYEEEEEDEDED